MHCFLLSFVCFLHGGLPGCSFFVGIVEFCPAIPFWRPLPGCGLPFLRFLFWGAHPWLRPSSGHRCILRFLFLFWEALPGCSLFVRIVAFFASFSFLRSPSLASAYLWASFFPWGVVASGPSAKRQVLKAARQYPSCIFSVSRFQVWQAYGSPPNPSMIWGVQRYNVNHNPIDNVVEQIFLWTADQFCIN